MPMGVARLLVLAPNSSIISFTQARNICRRAEESKAGEWEPVAGNAELDQLKIKILTQIPAPR
jgi:hypothetical protein